MRTLTDAEVDRHAAEIDERGDTAEIARGFDERLQRLCGYGTYRGLIGHIDTTGPRQLLTGDASLSMIWDAS